MDYTKNVVGILIVLMMLMVVPTASAFVEYANLVTEDGKAVHVSEEIVTQVAHSYFTNVTGYFSVVSSDRLLPEHAVMLKISPYDGTANSSTNITFSCTNYPIQYNMSESEYWNTYGFTYVPFYLDQVGINDYYADTCLVYVEGEDVFIESYIVPVDADRSIITINTELLYGIPNDAMGELMTGTRNIVLSAFDIMEMLLVVSALILFIFVIVFIWKLIEYFATRVSRKGRLD